MRFVLFEILFYLVSEGFLASLNGTLRRPLSSCIIIFDHKVALNALLRVVNKGT